MRPRSIGVLVVLLATACGSGKNTTGTGGQGTGGHPGTGGSSSGTGGAGGQAPVCGTDGWVTYGHDGKRSSASDGCVQGPLTMLWSYAPAPPAGKTVVNAFHPLATKDAAFLHWSASDAPYTGTSAADRVSLDGMRGWTFDSGTDTDFGDWGSIWGDKLALESDGVYLLDLASGQGVGTTGVDWWGQTLPAGATLYVSDTAKGDGPGIFAGALDATAKVLWQGNLFSTACSDTFADQTGGIALDGGALFYAPSYASSNGTPSPVASGVYAFDAATGAKRWSVPSSPASAVSAGGGLVFLVEGAPGATKLVARKQSDGSAAWQVDLATPGVQAPALAAGKVLVAANGSVSAFGQADGKPVWVSAGPAPTYAAATSISFGCGTVLPMATLRDTAIAVATGSDTFVEASGADLSVVSLATGEVLWSAKPGAVGALVNPVIVGDRVYVVDRAGPMARLLAFQGAAQP